MEIMNWKHGGYSDFEWEFYRKKFKNLGSIKAKESDNIRRKK